MKHSVNRLFLSTRHTFIVIDIIDLPLMVLEIMQVQGPKGFPFLAAFVISATIAHDPGIA